MILKTICALLICLGPWSVPASAQSKGVQVGDIPSYTFRRPLLNGMGASSLEDLRGKPVFIVYWARMAPGVDDSMREALVWQEAYGDDLTVLFVEIQDATDLQVASLALKKKWLGGRAMWTTELPCRNGLYGSFPQFVLLSSQGVVVDKGTSEIMELGYRDDLVAKIEGLLDAQVELRRRGPAGYPSGLTRAWKTFSEGHVEKALRLAQALAAEPGGDQAAGEETLTVLHARLERRLDRAAWQIQNGYLYQAEQELTRLEEQLSSELALAARQAKLSAALDDEALKPEWKAAKDLAKLEKKLYAKGSRSVLIKQLARLARTHSGTKTAERAAWLVEAAETPAYK
jgi:hypothetical protein